MFKIKSKFSVLFAALFFLFGIATFTLENATATTSTLQGDNPCYHCGTISACEDGGQPYGYTDCTFNPEQMGEIGVCDVSNYYCEEA